MAAWGQGDPRWIVEHRDDGANVNNWHWTEKNKLEWARQRLGELLPGLQASMDAPAPYVQRVTSLKSLTGEVGAGRRGGPGLRGG